MCWQHTEFRNCICPRHKDSGTMSTGDTLQRMPRLVWSSGSGSSLSQTSNLHLRYVSLALE
ncbi:hypothetical protein DPMN_172941 [Dreissena polymorpha]|uniref:Uncharacterized protein n=1 Tax=Dreissena polymorpha TaxID=45954 RepID=A0A9D4E452_DREPO|nr:hypothetical protein DPMN_172941 [Dreissena polymorpha]